MNAFDFATADFAEDAIESQGQGQQSITRFSEDNRFNTISIQNVLFDGANPNVTFDPTGGIIATDGSPSTGGSFEIQSGVPHRFFSFNCCSIDMLIDLP